jgi:hypothetical protein
LKEATGWNRSAEAATGDPKTAKARSLLVRIMALVGESGTPPAPASAAAGALAEEALAVDPSSTDWRRISTELTKLRDTLARGGTWEQIRQSVGEAVRPLVAISRKNAVRAGETAADQDRLRSAWADEARRR